MFNPLFLIFALGAAMFCGGVVLEPNAAVPVKILIAGGYLFAMAALFWTMRRFPFRKSLNEMAEEHVRLVDALPLGRVALWIFLASALGLFFELLIIRWHSSSLHVFNFFKNVSLFSCFLGLGIGYSMGRRRIHIALFLPGIALQFILLHMLRFTPLQFALNNPIPTHIIMGMGNADTVSRFLLIYGFFAFFFSLNALTFIPLGQLAGSLMGRTGKLSAYGWNLSGGLFGIAVFALLSFLWLPPAAWLAVGAIGLIPFLYRSARTLSIAFVSLVAALAVISINGDRTSLEVYSPYQFMALHLQREAPPILDVNHLLFQSILDLRGPQFTPKLKGALDYYDFPYQALERPVRDVLVVGSGTGNDVAAALRHGVQHVDAVEIDPAILEFGKRLHPENPYGDPRVTAITDDARTYIRRAKKSYDLIVYGLLDAHTTMSGISSVRLDSFVYTVEAFQESLALLSKDGVLSVKFALWSPAHGRKFYLMLQEASKGKPPVVCRGVFYAGPGASSLKIPPPAAGEISYADKQLHADVSTDDWPFVYMPVRSFPFSYAILIGFLSIVSLIILRALLGGGKGALSFSPVFFFLGAGFMLLEAKNITRFGLLMGNTWFVITLAIAGVMVMGFFSNLLVARLQALKNPSALKAPLLYAPLLLLLGLSYFFSGETIGLGHPMVQKAAGLVFLSLPFFFSGIIFSSELCRQSRVSIGSAMASNLMGAILGGFLEYSATIFGYRSLSIVAFLFYTAALIFSLSLRSSGQTEAPVKAGF
jgi:SAM-dependent methyltransferase